MPRSPRGYSFLSIGMLLLLLLFFQTLNNPQEIARGIIQLFRL